MSTEKTADTGDPHSGRDQIEVPITATIQQPEGFQVTALTATYQDSDDEIPTHSREPQPREEVLAYQNGLRDKRTGLTPDLWACLARQTDGQINVDQMHGDDFELVGLELDGEWLNEDPSLSDHETGYGPIGGRYGRGKALTLAVVERIPTTPSGIAESDSGKAYRIANIRNIGGEWVGPLPREFVPKTGVTIFSGSGEPDQYDTEPVNWDDVADVPAEEELTQHLIKRARRRADQRDPENPDKQHIAHRRKWQKEASQYDESWGAALVLASSTFIRTYRELHGRRPDQDTKTALLRSSHLLLDEIADIEHGRGLPSGTEADHPADQPPRACDNGGGRMI